jgi:hypothetical protein
MSDTKNKRIKIVLFSSILIALLSGAIFLLAAKAKASDPSGVHVTIYQADLFTAATGTSVTVFSNSAGKTVDIVGNPDVFGSGPIAAGTYKRIKFIVKNQVDFAGPDPCSTASPAPNISKTFLIDSTGAADAQVPLYFATSDDNGSSGWTANGSATTPFLIQNPIDVQGNMNTVVKLIFNTAGTLVCNSSAAILNPPTMNALSYVEQTPSASCTFPAEYWIVSYNLFNSMTTTNPTFQQELERAGVDAGWGTMTFSAPDPTTHVGTWSMTNTTYDNGGQAEHNHMFSLLSDGVSGNYNDGYVNPTNTGSSPVSATYTLNGGKIILSSGGWSMEGAFSNDCSTMVGVSLTGPSDNNLIYAMKKPSGLGAALAANSTYVMINNGLEIQYNMSGTAPYPSQGLSFSDEFTVLTLANNGQFFEWNPKLFLTALSASGTTTWVSPGPGNTARFDINTGTTLGANVRSDGLVTFPSDTTMNSVIMLGTSGSGVGGGDWVPQGVNDHTLPKHRLNAGLWLNPAQSPLLSDLSGTWKIGVLGKSLTDADSTWGNGNEKAEAAISYGDFSIDGATGNMCGVFTHKEVLSKTMTYESGCWTVELHTECYSCDQAINPTCLDIATPAANCSTNSVPGIVIPVFYMVKNSVVDIKFTLDKSKTTIGIWKPIQKTTTPAQCFPSQSQSGTCPNSTTATMAGMGVKL